MKAKRRLYVLLTGLILSFIPLNEALAKELVQVTIVGPGLAGEIEVTDPEALQLFGSIQYAGQVNGVPPQLPAAYFEIHEVLGHGEEIIATNIFHYYPSPDGESSYFYYADVRGGWSSAEGTWFILSEPSDRALRAYLGRLGASPEAMDTAAQEQPAQSTSPAQPLQQDVLALFYRFARLWLQTH